MVATSWQVAALQLAYSSAQKLLDVALLLQCMSITLVLCIALCILDTWIIG
jgi:hypothetical protein